MLTPILMVCSEAVSRDAETNTISIFTIFENFNSPSFPLLIPKLVVFNLFERVSDDPQIFDCTVRVLINELQLHEVPIRINFEDKMKSRTILTVGGLLIPNPGILTFNFIHDTRTIAQYKIEVINTGQPTTQTIP
jgi:hypothetical protein